MPKSLLISSMFALLFFHHPVFANEACLLETNATFMGVKLDIKDCIQNAGMAANDFKAQCEGVSQAVVSMGGPAAQITYLSSCPVPFQAKCDHSTTAKTVFFYYKRSSDEAAGIESSCGLMQGQYTKGSL
ncbi:MAG: hypothetical protein KJ556_06420 [Gammaproteobacteria bacterium]|nr:hypothetical protein [Gammaproteobacteria bacterium]MBU2057716.1 hypothetical protein [Gammaproteobacteria bacterium]MBU2174744.1 hypothetical protein [Gammaproteobacteria bacterium]MBU2249001.1 hypothetical protein [Gammaproteobacteria bacterium]MBU2343956.1 hypothetical protein [Gammaproteobacteria bacterium]